MKQLLFLFAFFPLFTFAQSGMPQITKALNSGDVETLSSYFDESIELSILEEEGIFSKAQALQKVRRFLTQNKVSSFTEVHQGASRSSDSQYVIGNLVTSGGTFRVYLYLTTTAGKVIVQEFRLDKE